MAAMAAAAALAAGAGGAALGQEAAEIAAAATASPAAPAAIPDALRDTGRVTGRPLPRFAALKRDRARVRRGPGTNYRVDWVFVRRGMPLEIVAEHGNWRRVRDVEGAGGWVHYALLTGRRSALVMDDMLPLRARPNGAATETARAEAGALLTAERCEGGWCRLSGEGARGWAPQDALWGVKPGETFD